ncbi:MAG TPA: phosphatidylserine decarboxylase family protein [Nitrospiraceae bacterium]|nr:phosphatidylserine decarboxylase family protein [Nitrospiraceae bacterium]
MADRAVGIPIVREGLPFIAATGGPAVLAGALGWTNPAVILGAMALFTAWFFRNPRRFVPKGAQVIVAPGDGRVMAIEQEYEPRFLKEQGIRLSIFLNIFDVHVNRIPCDGRVEEVVYQPGRFLAANRPDATLRNEQNALMIRTASGVRVLCVQVAGVLARRIVCWASPGEKVTRGERFGLIRFGSRMDTFLPLSTILRVAVGDCVKGGETILGELPCVEP